MAGGRIWPIEEDSRVKSNIWVRDGADIIYASKAIGTGEATELSGVSVYRRDEGGTLNHIISADIAGYTGDGWKLAGAEEFDILSGKKRPLGMVILGSDITPDQFTLSNVDADSMTFFELRDAIENLQMVGRKTASLEADMWHKISLIVIFDAIIGRGGGLWPGAFGAIIPACCYRYGFGLCLFCGG